MKGGTKILEKDEKQSLSWMVVRSLGKGVEKRERRGKGKREESRLPERNKKPAYKLGAVKSRR